MVAGVAFSAAWGRIARRGWAAVVGATAILTVDRSVAAVTQPQAYHVFADQRAWFGVANAADVFSSAAFFAVGLLGLWRLRAPAASVTAVTRASLVALFAGLTLTAFGSAYYHSHPTDRTLVWDRLPMTISFAGVYGAVVAQRIGVDAGRVVLLAMLVLGPATVAYWAVSGDLLPYAALQLGLVAAVFLLVVFPRNSRDWIPWPTLLALYVVAKLAEASDAAIWNATNGLFAGHLIKHLAAALGCLAVARAIPSPRVPIRDATPGELGRNSHRTTALH